MNRSLLFIPAKEKMLGKIVTFNADKYIIDLEDSIGMEEKEEALNLVVKYLKENKEEYDKLYVRINSDNFMKELKALKSFKIGFMLPKFENVLQYQEAETILKKHPVMALIESPMGIVNAKEIIMLPYVESVAFGAEDYTANVNMINDDKYLLSIKSLLVNNAKAFNKKVYDTPSFKITEEELFKEEVKTSVELGFDGKLLIHPKHIDYINEMFSNSDIENMKKIVELYEKQSEAVFVLDGKVYEKMHIARMKKIIKENGGIK